jgi:hypothetical protein
MEKETNFSDNEETKPSDNYKFQEWLICQESIRRFDGMILDIRKYGFTLLTVLLSADGLLYAKTNLNSGQAIGIYLALMALIFGLFLVDRCHEVFLRGAVQRAHELEEKLHMGLSQRITAFSKHMHTATWGTSLYIFFSIANTCLIMGVLVRIDTMDSFIASIKSNKIFALTALLIGIITIVSILIYHIPAKRRIRRLVKLLKPVAE